MQTLNPALSPLNFTARDTTGQRRFAVKKFRPDRTVGELIAFLLTRMRSRRDAGAENAQAFHAYLDRESRHLRSAEIVGDVLREGDQVRIDQDLQAGGC